MYAIQAQTAENKAAIVSIDCLPPRPLKTGLARYGLSRVVLAGKAEIVLKKQ